MEQSTAKAVTTESTESTDSTRTKRPRSATMIKIQWFAEQVRKTLRIKDQIESGSYRVDSTSIAKALLNRTEE